MRDDYTNSNKIEDKAIRQLEDYLEDSNIIDPFVPRRDKEPIWDGHLYLYTNKRMDKESFYDKVSVQVKGKTVPFIKAGNFKYSIEKADLKAYLKDPVIYIVCQIKENPKERKLFYRNLLPETVKNILKGKEKLNKISVAMKPMPDNYKDFEDIVLKFVEDRLRQLPYALKESMSMEEVVKRGIREFEFSTPAKPMNHIAAMQYISSQPTFLYAKLDAQYDVTIPIAGGEFNLIFKADQAVDVKVGDRVFYDHISTYIEGGLVSISAAKALTIECRDVSDLSSINVQVHCKSDELKERIKEYEFLLALHHKKIISIGDLEFAANVENIGNVNLLEQQLSYLRDVQALLEKLHVTKPFLLSKIKPGDDALIRLLIRSILHNEILKDSSGETGLRILTFADIRILIWCSSNVQAQATQLGDFFDGRIVLGYNRKGKKILASPFSYIGSVKLWGKIDNIPFDQQIPSYVSLTAQKEYVYEMANGDVLSMISCADKILKKDLERYNLIMDKAARLCTWLEQQDNDEQIMKLYHLNLLQINKRLRDLSDSETNWLQETINDTNTSDIVKFGASALLADRDSFELYRSKLDPKELKKLQKQPIANFFMA